MSYLVETRQKGCHWIQSKGKPVTITDAKADVYRIGLTVKSRRLSGLFEARIIRQEHKHWKREGFEPETLFRFDL